MTPMQSAGALLGWIVVLTWLAVRAAGRLHLPVRGPRMLALLAVLTGALCVWPLGGGLSFYRYATAFADHWSVPLLGILASDISRRMLGVELLRPPERRAGWWFGALGGLVLYPMALGLGNFDPYTLGWKFGPLFVALAVAGALLLYRGNRFGVVLVIAGVGWHLGLVLGQNLWDLLLDPLYCVISIAALIRGLVAKPREAGPSAAK